HPPKWTGYQLLALIFGTLLSSQGTDASFVLTLAGFPPGFVLRFRLYQTLSCPIPGRSGILLFTFQVFAFAFPFPAVPTLPDSFPAPFTGVEFEFGGRWGPFPFGRFRPYQVSLG
ncbi:hypothetical protein ACFWAR_37145, partial [Streptomyces sp. NPDC059917]|uniref:hypothetical protein n=1 Tax=Streptomyces sp. NPDC059917 TaxID=3347002 RepID=UPI00364A698E